MAKNRRPPQKQRMPTGNEEAALGRGLPIALAVVCLIAGCGQPYQMLPPGSDAALLQRSRVAFDATVASGGISVQKILVEESIRPGWPMESATYHVDFRVERMLKGERAERLVPISHLNIDNHYLPVRVPEGLAPALIPRLYPGFHYLVGYQFEFLGHLYGLILMPRSQPEPILRALRRCAEHRGISTMRGWL